MDDEDSEIGTTDHDDTRSQSQTKSKSGATKAGAAMSKSKNDKEKKKTKKQIASTKRTSSTELVGYELVLQLITARFVRVLLYFCMERTTCK